MAKKVKPDKEKPTPSTTSEQRLLRFDDLRARGIVSNWMTLARWIQNEDFPPGLRLGGRLRAWRAVDSSHGSHRAHSPQDPKRRPPITKARPPEGVTYMAKTDIKAINTELKAETPATEHDPFDLNYLRLDQSFLESSGVKKLLRTVPVRKPNPQDFVRVHPDPAYRLALAVIELKDDREIYLLPPPIAHQLPGEYSMTILYTAINRQGVLHLWPVKLPGSDGKVLDWHRSAAEAAERAMERWIRVKANMSLGAYEISEASATIPDPEWPQLSYQELLRIAFKDRLVNNLDHPVVKRLRGLT
jgi:hypothetical protein